MDLDGLLGDEQRLRDLAVGGAVGGELCDPPFAWREGLDAGEPPALWTDAGGGQLGERLSGAESRRCHQVLPENRRKLEAAEALGALAGEAGMSLIELAIAFVLNHPAVTSGIIGPRTMEQLDSQLPAAAVTLDGAVLDRIDEIVRPGVNLNPADTSYGEQVLNPPLRRR
jgi:hypothetical protein